MNNKQFILIAVLILTLSLFPACQPQKQASLSVTSMESTAPAATESPTVIQTISVTQDILPTATPLATVTEILPPTVIPPPTETPQPTIQSDFVRRLCPDLKLPLGLFALADPYIYPDTDSETVFTPYQVAELQSKETKNPCTLYLSPGPMGEPQLGGNGLFWHSFDHDAESVTIWQYDPLHAPGDDDSPQHMPLLPTTIDTSLGKAGLTDFVVSDDGELLVWSYTDPRLNEDNQYGYVQTIYAISPGKPIDQRPVTEIWFDVVPETDGQPHIIRLRRISAGEDRIYFSDEPIGLGRQWPQPLGQYSSLYSISTGGDAYPESYYDCGHDHWCISDFSEELDLLLTIENDANAIEIKRMSDGESISKIQAPETYNIVRKALIGPSGAIAFMGVALEGSIFDGSPTDVAIFYSEPPYNEDPVLVFSDARLLDLLGWVSSEQILAAGNRLDDGQPEGSTIPSRLMLIDMASKSGTWVSADARGFTALVP